jgi:hypothetical protein
MKPAMALIVGLLLVGQAVAQPVQAADTGSAGTTVRGQTDKSPVKPGGLSPTDSLTAGPIGDVKVQLDSAWWVGSERHSKYKISNVGNGISYDVKLFKQYFVVEPSIPDDDHFESNQVLGDMPPAAFTYVTIVCKPKAGWQCDKTRMKALTPGSDLNPGNNDAEDDV